MSNPFIEGQTTSLEVLDRDGVTWNSCKAAEMSMDGRVGLRWNDKPEVIDFVDLTRCKYRFVM